MLDLLPRTVFKRSITESVSTYDGICVNCHIVADDHARIDACARVDCAILAYLHSVADIRVLIDF